jgi:hypothetical protein
MSLRSESWEPESIIVTSGKSVACITVQGPRRSADDYDRPFASLYDSETGRGGTILTLHGQPVTRADLLAWFAKAKAPKLILVIDDERYGHVAEAHFS